MKVSCFFFRFTDLTVSKSFSEAFSALLMQVGQFWRGDVEYEGKLLIK